MGRSVVYSQHATLQMAVRKITPGEVLLALNNPDRSAPARYGATNFWKYIDGRVIRVTAFRSNNEAGKRPIAQVTIITVAIAGGGGS